MNKKEFLDGIDQVIVAVGIMEYKIKPAMLHFTNKECLNSFSDNFKPIPKDDEEWIIDMGWISLFTSNCPQDLTRRLFYLEMFKEWTLCYESYREY